ncbi:MAG: SufS family cysteine desulfurase [Thiothrix sp.]|nr:SufS family cysteine desulfurase [Thiothrix sp.]HPQ94552.1 SufS family cysteine desulfurase [Thiolinea sp.]
MKTGFDPRMVRQDFPFFSSREQPYHYLDNAATAQMHAAAFEAMHRHDLENRANVMRGNHRLAERATTAYESARQVVARFINAAHASEIVFTGGTTAAINLVAASLGSQWKPGDEVVVSQAEHHSNLLPWQALQARGIVLRVLPLQVDGCLETEALATLIGPRCKLVAVTHASNVTGAVTDVAAVVAAARQVGAWVLLDGAQRVQHGPLDVQALGCDFYAFSGHKCFGPSGIGVLWGQAAWLDRMPPFLRGGGMVGRVEPDQADWAPAPRRFEAGTPPITQAVGLAAVLEALMQWDWDAVHAHEAALQQLLLQGLQALPGLRLLGPVDGTARLPLASFSLAELHPHDLCQVLDGQGVAVRGGHHCAQPLMAHFGVEASVRASLACYNDRSDVDALLAGLVHAREVLA